MKKKAIYNGSKAIIKGKEITIIGETNKYYNFRIRVGEFTPSQRNIFWFYNIYHKNGYVTGRVSKRCAKLCDILPDELFKM